MCSQNITFLFQITINSKTHIYKVVTVFNFWLNIRHDILLSAVTVNLLYYHTQSAKLTFHWGNKSVKDRGCVLVNNALTFKAAGR